MSDRNDPDIAAAWSVAFHAILHPARIAALEAFLRIDEPLSPRLVYEVLDHAWPSATVSYHVHRLADGGVLTERFTEPARGATEHFYSLTR